MERAEVKIANRLDKIKREKKLRAADEAAEKKAGGKGPITVHGAVSEEKPLPQLSKLDPVSVDTKKGLRDPEKVDIQAPVINDITPVQAHEEEAVKNEEGANTLGSWIEDHPNFLVGMAPLLMGAMMNDLGTGASVAGDMLLNKEKREWKARQDELKRRQVAGKRGTYQYKTVEMPDGSIQYMKVDTRTGESEPTGLTAGYKHSIITDPRTEEKMRVSGASEMNRLVSPVDAKYNVKQQRLMRDFRKQLLSDKRFSANLQTIDATDRALALLQAGNPIADEGIKTIFPRMFGEVGNLAAAEQERFSGSPAFRRKLDKLRTRWEKGLLTNEDRADLMEVAQVMRAYSSRRSKAIANDYIQSEKGFGYDPTQSVRPFMREPVQQPAKDVEKAKSMAPTAGKPPMVQQPAKKKGYIEVWKLNAMGEYEFLKEVKAK